ncbi:baseplate J/gp47 family protein [Methanolobus sediminis]|uniref:Baseplate J/gp47 family protein n=1 Tax=Methanolobus sediminis TaxID=3072978 RepID=A0AA51UL38_9EURY|nr:baseplate J/gp47 family protein [Methanolobus sediminis]WMW25083.1 baseplate J/gp47 family protein [Methanolobus sediminis]
MAAKTPVLDTRTSEDIYEQSLRLARHYCPELAIPQKRGYFDPDDPGLVILRLFSDMAENLITQFNKIPDKHRLAFFDFMGVNLLSAKPSKVPLTFYLAEGSSGSFVPRGTQVVSSEDSEVVFETTQGLSVVPAKLNAVFSLNSWEDKYTDHSKVVSGEKEKICIFGGDADEKPLDHVFYMGDDILLHMQNLPSELKFHLEGKNLFKEYFDLWYDGNNNLIENPEITSSQDAKKLDIIFNDKTRDIQSIQKFESSSIDGIESFWLHVKPHDTKIVDGTDLPAISNISMDLTVENITPDAAFFNVVPLDMKKGFYPFGEVPKKRDTLYIGSEEVFSKKGATITFDVELEYDEAKNENKNLVLQWEYWNGNGWEPLTVIDNTEAFTRSGQVFIETCPSIPPIEINGQLNKWIRMRVISEKLYETDGRVKSEEDHGFGSLYTTLKRSTHKIRDSLDETDLFSQDKSTVFNPPFIQSINISYSYEGVGIGKLRSFNNFQYRDLAPEEPGKIYETCQEKLPVFYLGFEEDIAGLPVTLFCAVKDKLYGEEPVRIKQSDYQDNFNDNDEATGLVWKYYNGISWKEFSVEDGSDSFRTAGIVSFSAPSDIKPTSQFGKELYWIRVESKDGKWLSCSVLNGIFPNTVWALNNTTSRNEILGSGNGEPDLTFNFSNRPVLEGQLVEVKESNIPSKGELKVIESEVGLDGLRVVEEYGEIKEVWVSWVEVNNFTLSGPLSRHYVLDRANGKIIFGDGNRGMVPHTGKNNIIARHYVSGGGSRGNVSSETITSLKKTIPKIDTVTNHVPSSGGMDMEDIESVIDRFPHIIKNRDRAVTNEDFEWLAHEASQYVARSKCVLKNDTITVIIVPKYEGHTPLPDSGLLRSVEMYLKDRAFFPILHKIKTIGPDYTQINAYVKVRPISLTESVDVLKRVEKTLKIFFHPLKGGPTGKGWNFGQNISTSQVAAVIEDIEGVDYVSEIKLTEGLSGLEKEEIAGVEHLLIEPDSLPCAGLISVEIEE